MIEKLFKIQKEYVNYFFDRVDKHAAQELLNMLFRCKGMVVFTGIGKSALAAKKVAVTMPSTGTRAIYLSPTNALHGDIGIISENDLSSFLAKAGKVRNCKKTFF